MRFPCTWRGHGVDDDDLVMRLAGLTHLEPMYDLCERLHEDELDGETRQLVEAIEERLDELEELLEAMRTYTLNTTVEEADAQLQALAAFFDRHAMRIVRRVHTARRTLSQDARWRQLYDAQRDAARAARRAQLEHELKLTCRCGRPMVLRFSATHEDHFWGCEGFPLCRHTLELNERERARLA